METFHFCTVYIRCATLTLDSAGLDVGVKTIRHVTRYLAPDWFQGAYSFQQAQLPTQAQSWASGAAFARFQPCPSHRATCPSAVSTWHPPQGRGPPAPHLRGPLKLCSLTANRGKPWSHFPKKSSDESGIPSLPSYKSMRRDLAGGKEILDVRIFPAPRSFKGGLLFSLSQKALSQPVDYLLCFLIYENTSLHGTSARAGRKGE